MSVNKERVDTIVDGIVEKTKNRSVKGEQTNPQKLADNAISYLKGSKLFQEANDTERETILRDVSKKLGVEIKAPTAKKLLGIKRTGKPTTIKVKSDYAALKKDLRKEQKIARDAKNDVNKRRKSKVEKANKLQKVIKKKLKGKEAGLSDAAKEFAKVNPSRSCKQRTNAY